jgi:hypothetical protein
MSPLIRTATSASPRSDERRAIELWEELPRPIRRRCHRDDAWAIDAEIRYRHIAAVAQKRKALAERMLDPNSPTLFEDRANFKAAVAADPVKFFRNCIWTRDPEAPVHRPRELPLLPYRFQVENWIRPWHRGIYEDRQRAAHEKTRRNLFTITIAGFELWAFRFLPGYKSWIATYKEKMVDNLDEWDSLFAKLRYMYRKCRQFYPWLFPALPSNSEHNKKMYLKFPRWEEGGEAIDEAMWGNEIIGCNPSDVSERGGACTRGVLDEAGWIADLDSFFDSIDDMTPHLIIGSTPPENAQHPFARIVKQAGGYEKNTAHWTHNPTRVAGIHWDEEADMRGPWSEKWRNPWYQQRLDENRGKLYIVSRNQDLDYEAAAGGKVFLGFSPSNQMGGDHPTDDDWDLYDPDWPLYVWFDLGRGDPWAFIWVQVSDVTNEIRIVDYYMRDNVTADFFAPMLGGWNFDRRQDWITAPDRMPWRSAVPWRYAEEEERIIRRWYGRKSLRWMRGAYDAHSRQSNSLHTVASIFQAYGFDVMGSHPAHQMEKWIDHGNACLPYVRVSGFLKGYRPQDQWPAIDEVFTYWSRMDSTEAGRAAKPKHDDYSHPGTAFIYGCQQISQPKPRRLGNPHSGTRRVDNRWHGPQTARKTPGRGAAGWL